MTNKKFKMAAMSLALTACVATAPLAANAEAPEETSDAGVSAATEHAETPEAGAPVEEAPVEEGTPAEEEASEDEETPEEKEASKEEAPEEKEEAPAENAVVDKEAPAEEPPVVLASAPAAAPAAANAKENADIPMENPDANIAAEDPDAGIATMDGAEKEVSTDEATIDGTSYGTLQGAIDSAKEGQTVVLNKNTSGSINIAKWIKLNLNDHTINGDVKVDLSKKQDDAATTQDGETAANKNTVEIYNGTITGATDSGVTIKDAGDTNVLLKDLTIEKNEGKQGGGVHIENSKNVTIDHCTIQNNSTTEVSKNGSDVSVGAGGGVFISDNSHVTIQNGSTIQGNTGTRGGGIYTEHSAVEVKDSTIANNTATDVPSGASNSNKGLGGGIYSYDSTLTVTDSTISGNEAKGSTSTITYNKNGELSSSTLGNGGGGICAVGKDSNVTLNKVTVTGNKAASNVSSNLGAGGGIEAQGGSLTVKDSTISDNNARGNGGGIFSAQGNVLDVSGSTIQGNKGNNGGGIHTGEARDPSKTPSKAIITDTKILDNEITGSLGGGVHVGTRANATLKDCTVAGNKADTVNGTGGGVSAFGIGVDVTLDNVRVENNTADGKNGKGGGVYLQGNQFGASSLTLKNGTIIQNNTANGKNGNGGGVYLKGNATLKSDGADGRVTISENKATQGAGIFTEIWKVGQETTAPHLVLNDTDVLNNIATSKGGGIHLTTGTTLDLLKSKVDGNTGGSGGGIFAKDDAKLNIQDSSISGNTATNGGWGGGIYTDLKNGSITIQGSTIESNKTTTKNAKGGGVSIAAIGSTQVTIDHNTIQGNEAMGDGGGLYIHNNINGQYKPLDTVVQITNNTIQNNSCGNSGAGIYLFGVNSVLDSNLITGNTIASGYGGGGGVRVDTTNSIPDSVTCTLKNNTISNNTAPAGGGVSSGSSTLIYSNKNTGITCTIIMESGSITGNHATSTLGSQAGGGGVHLVGNGTRFVMKGGVIEGNDATANGGGVFSTNYEGFKVLGGAIQNNTAKLNGGAIFIQNALPNRVLANGAVTNTPEQEVLEIGAPVIITGNSAGQYGGGIFAANGVTVKMAGHLLNNHAGEAGDDLYMMVDTNYYPNGDVKNVLVLRPVTKEDDWTLTDCGHIIDGWYLDNTAPERWNADKKLDAEGNELPAFIVNLNTLLEGSDYTITVDENGNYVITLASDQVLALKAAHDVIPEPTPDPEPEPEEPETPVPPETPKKPETPETPETPVEAEVPQEPGDAPVAPAAPDAPTVQDATVAALPKTGVNWMMALAMALSGMALTVAGAVASLFAKSKH